MPDKPKQKAFFLQLNPFLLIIILLMILLRIPSLFEPYWYGDEGIYLTLGQAIRKGLLLYRDIHDNKPPLLYLLAALAGNVAWFRELLLIWSVFTLISFSALIKRLFPKKRNFYYFSLTVFALLSTLPWLEGNIANAEVFMLLPTFLGLLLFWPEKKESSTQLSLGKAFLAGLFFSASFHFKTPGLFDLMALGLLGLFYLKKKNFVFQISKLLALTAGFVFPLVCFSIYFASNGALNYYLQATLWQNFSYLGSWQAGSMDEGNLNQNTGLMIRALLLGVGSLGLFIFKKHFRKEVVFTLLWFLFVFFAALLSERPYAHYLIQLLPPAVFLAGLLLFWPTKKVKLIVLGLLLFLVFSLQKIDFWFYPTPAYYQNFGQFVLSQQTKEEYFAWFDPKVNHTYTLANYLVKRTAPDERVFIWTDTSSAYALSRKLPPGRYTTAYHIADFNGWQETFAAIEKNQPNFIVIDSSEKRDFPKLKEYLSKNYRLEKELNNYLLFRQNNQI